MRSYSLSEAKDKLSQIVAEVRRGQRVRILVRGVPAAEIVPAPYDASSTDERLADLERRGVIRRARTPLPPELLEPGPDLGGRPLADIVDEERDEGP